MTNNRRENEENKKNRLYAMTDEWLPECGFGNVCWLVCANINQNG